MACACYFYPSMQDGTDSRAVFGRRWFLSCFCFAGESLLHAEYQPLVEHPISQDQGNAVVDDELCHWPLM